MFICVPPFVHGPVEDACIAAGLHLFVEKPVALAVATARNIDAAAKAKGLVTAAGYHWRYMGATDLTRELAAREELGFVITHFLGGVPGTPWWRRLAKSGGQIVEQATHLVDLARYFCGEVASVTAAGSRTIMHRRLEGHDIWDTQTASLTFESGVVASVTASNVLSGGGYAGFKLYTPDACYEIMEAPATGSQLIVYRKGSETRYDGRAHGWRQPHYVGADAFLDAVLTADPSRIRSTYADAIRTLAVTLANNAACETGQPVNPNEFLASP